MFLCAAWIHTYTPKSESAWHAAHAWIPVNTFRTSLADRDELYILTSAKFPLNAGQPISLAGSPAPIIFTVVVALGHTPSVSDPCKVQWMYPVNTAPVCTTHRCVIICPLKVRTGNINASLPCSISCVLPDPLGWISCLYENLIVEEVTYWNHHFIVPWTHSKLVKPKAKLPAVCYAPVYIANRKSVR